MLETMLFTCLMMQAGLNTAPPASKLLSAIPSRGISFGPHGDRMGEVAVYEKDPKIFYMCSCNGGVLKTINGGTTFNFVFDKVGSASIGSLAISQKNPDVLWVGTGDKWQRNSVGMGDGIYKTTDGGRTWQDMGLKNSVSIGRIVIDPKNEDTVMVAVLGSPWGYGPDRGIYKTTDGGKNWRKVLYTNEKCAGNDVNIDPKNSKNMLAALWDHIHYPYGWYFGGPGSGIYRSTDGGETWHRAKGLPQEKVGRIFVGYYDKDPKLAAAYVEEETGSGFYRSWDGGETWKMMPALSAKDKKRMDWGRSYYDNLDIIFHPTNPDIIYFGNIACRTEDGGKTIMGGKGDDHGGWINPNDPKHYIMTGDVNSYQGWNFQYGSVDWVEDKTAVEFEYPCVFQTYGCGYDMRKLYWVMGNPQDDGAYTAPSQSTRGATDGSETISIFGHEAGRSMADPDDWTIIYAQGPSNMLHRVDLTTNLKKNLPLPRSLNYDNVGEYAHYQKMNPKMRTNRFPPFEISPWNSKTLYFGMNMLVKSTDRGDHWKIISPDLTHNKPEWQVPDENYAHWHEQTNAAGDKCYQTINAICESPLKQDMIWVGTDDGYVWLTQDGGKNWDNVTKNFPGLPEYSWCSRIEASKFAEGRAYATFCNYRWFDLKSYIYVTEDSGKSWTKITGNMKDEPIRVIKEGLKNPDLLFVGTEFGLWASLDRGKSWDYYQDWSCPSMTHYLGTWRKGYLPRVSVHDLQIHPREDDLIIGTHGRGIWIMSIKPLEEMTPVNRAKEVYFTTPGNVYLFPLRNTDFFGSANPTGDNTQPGTVFAYYLKHDAKGNATIRFEDSTGRELAKLDDHGGLTLNASKYEIAKAPAKAGLNTIQWMNQGLIRRPGDYRVVLTIDGKEYVQNLHVEDASDEVLPGGTKTKYPENGYLEPKQ